MIKNLPTYHENISPVPITGVITSNKKLILQLKLFNMRKFFIIIFLFTASLNITAAEDPIASQIDKLMDEYTGKELFSGVVLLAKDGNIIYEKAYGYANWDKKTPINTSTLFNIGSINKDFTRLLILQLEKEGKLKLSDPLNKYLDIYPEPAGSKITIQMLLDMQAGLGDYIMSPGFMKNAKNIKTIDDHLAIIRNEPLLYEPGTSREYSNSGYVVLGAIVEKITGKTFEQSLQEKIFQPLGMQNTYYSRETFPSENRAEGTDITFSGKKKASYFWLHTTPAGGIYTNARDLLKIDMPTREAFKLTGRADVRAGGTPAWNAVTGQYPNGYTLVVLSNFGSMAEEVEPRIHSIIKDEAYAPVMPTVQMKFYSVIKEHGLDYFKAHYENILKEYGLNKVPPHLNVFGYGLMEEGELDLAIEIFKYNVELFPRHPNMYDSLGEAYMNKGNKELAILNYKKTLELEPENRNAQEKLREIENSK